MNGAYQTAICAECGAAFGAENMIRYGGNYVCATCKPVFMQKLAEGVNVGNAVRYAGFWIRLGATILDGFIMGSVMVAVFIVAGVILFSSRISSPLQPGQPPDQFIFIIMAFYAFAGGLVLSYETFFTGKYGGTPGKLICGLRVVTSGGGRVTYLRALARQFAKFLSQMVLYIGFIMAAFDDEKRALHDWICDTRVILK